MANDWKGFASGVPNRSKSHNHQDILAFSMAMKAPLPYVKDCRPYGGSGAVLVQEGLEAGCLGPLLKMRTSLCGFLVPATSLWTPLWCPILTVGQHGPTPVRCPDPWREKHPTWQNHRILVLISQFQERCNTYPLIQDIQETVMQNMIAVRS